MAWIGWGAPRQREKTVAIAVSSIDVRSKLVWFNFCLPLRFIAISKNGSRVSDFVFGRVVCSGNAGARSVKS